MSQRTERELLDVAQWFNYWRKEPMPIEKRLEFYERTLDFLIWMIAGAAGDIQKLERGPQFVFPRHLVRLDKNLRTATGYVRDNA